MSRVLHFCILASQTIEERWWVVGGGPSVALVGRTELTRQIQSHRDAGEVKYQVLDF